MEYLIYAKPNVKKIRMRLKIKAIKKIMLPVLTAIFITYLVGIALGINYEWYVHLGIGIVITVISPLRGLECE